MRDPYHDFGVVTGTTDFQTRYDYHRPYLLEWREPKKKGWIFKRNSDQWQGGTLLFFFKNDSEEEPHDERLQIERWVAENYEPDNCYYQLQFINEDDNIESKYKAYSSCMSLSFFEKKQSLKAKMAWM